ncbi:hypothetical protein [Streptomyces chartreusis]|uniref:Uncharacterized protein n=1 Tax=Streptomyces chartreusis TaxID=1969 RepID=A0A7H8T2A3_STRCX|nr:hypothetical protein [Streptomyces chartreusis]QKZ17625.1 hypothetical protein HUT05_09885 [Streptomyces chartreusis]
MGLFAERLVKRVVVFPEPFREIFVFLQQTIQLAFVQMEELLYLVPAQICGVQPGQLAISLVQLLLRWCRAVPIVTVAGCLPSGR